ncbi:MAG: hypothetical protein QG667_560 [Pseudomonadota bacterium]|jgi:hypothetical protein|nr:hypothetical protein [Pseudomonadota bacterium]
MKTGNAQCCPRAVILLMPVAEDPAACRPEIIQAPELLA